MAYSADEDRIILGWPGGKLEVCAVVEDDGSPGETLCSIHHHKADIVCVGWSAAEEIISVSDDGAWAVSSWWKLKRNGR